MKSLKDKFINAFKGILLGIQDTSLLLQIFIALIAIIVGLIFKLNVIEWCILLLCCLIIISLEFVNTVIEKIMDFVHPEYHEKIKDIKDMGAGFVLLASILVLLIGIILFGSKIIDLFIM